MAPHSGNRHRQNRRYLLRRNGNRLIQKSRSIKDLERIQAQNRCLDPHLRLNWGSFSTDVRLRQYPASGTSWRRPWRRRLWRRAAAPAGPARRAVRLSSCRARPARWWADRAREVTLQPGGRGRLVFQVCLPMFRPMANRRSVPSSCRPPALTAPALPRPRASLCDPPTYVRKSRLRQEELCSRLTFISSAYLINVVAALEPVSPKTIKS